MATQLVENKVNDKTLVQMAKKRIDLPDNWIDMKYSYEADVLFILCSSNKPKRSKGDVRNGIVYDYDAQDNLVSIELTDLLGVFATA